MPLTTLFFPRIAKLAPKLALISVFKKHITETKLEGKALNEEVIKLEAPAKTLQGSEDSESEKKKPNVLNCNIKPVEDSLRSAIEIDSQFRPISGERSSSLDYIKTYVEFSFSDLNLAKMNKSSFYSYIPLKEVLELDFIKKLNVDQEILVEVIKGSSHLQLDEEKKMVRRLDPITVINDDTAPLIDWFNYFKAVTRLSDLSTALLQYFQLDNLPPLFCLNPAIIRCGELGSPELVKKIFEGLKLRGKKPLTSHMFSYCVALVQYGDMKGALAILNDAIDQGVKPDSSLWTQFFNAVCRNGRVQDALLLFDFMKKSGVKPSVVTYTLLMEACGVHDKEKLLLLLNEMQSLGIADTLHYTCYLKVLKEEGNLKEAVDLVQTMKQRGVKLSLRTYEIYLATVARSGDIKFALNILAEIDALTDKRSPAVYRALLYCCYVAEDLEEAKRISLELLRDGYKLDRTNYHSLLAVGRKQSFQYTQKVFEMMKADGLLDTLSCNLLIFSAARIKRFDAAWECYEQMLKDGSTKPDHVTLSGLLYAKGMAFGLEKAFEFLNTLKQVYSRDWRGEWDRGSDSGGPFCRITASAPTCLSVRQCSLLLIFSRTLVVNRAIRVFRKLSSAHRRQAGSCHLRYFTERLR
ncbi:uncharacterized protein LOC135145713 isoform X2 [Zophobas morio]|uniref:uncharacterized protein LOC135145713 isoform X2 n=1 Tax=Zophobas morio TaxID=2755281 RepID=UPI003083D81F